MEDQYHTLVESRENLRRNQKLRTESDSDICLNRQREKEQDLDIDIHICRIENQE
jgi:hypothetical protein